MRLVRSSRPWRPCPECDADLADAINKTNIQLMYYDTLLDELQSLEGRLSRGLETYTDTGSLAGYLDSTIAPLLAKFNEEDQLHFQVDKNAQDAVVKYLNCSDDCMNGKYPKPDPNQPRQPPPQRYQPDPRFPLDPNEKTGPGVGTAGFVAAGATLPYLVTFENQPTATAAVDEATVTDALSSDLNWTTFQLGEITFGSTVIAVPSGLQSYSTTVETANTDGTALVVDVSAAIDLSTGVVTWTFRSVDPATGELPLGVDDGFLPTEDGSGRGTASVAYTVQPLASLANGTSSAELSARAVGYQQAGVRLVVSQLGAEAAVHGAAGLVIRRIIDDPSLVADRLPQ